ncbi:hypothetical protein IFM89_024237 [Coptis chinensis]|uniref:Uncharacterized protein n=1 Tax=Coptis chinensis TaxID=261450 RepID=A0A835GXT8_9MAGN|nr:hypothetical protein IFM89_024237 [Coptis chinensis]
MRTGDAELEMRGRCSAGQKAEDSHLNLFPVQEYKFPRRFDYLKLDYLLGYNNVDLSKLLISKLQNPCCKTTKKVVYSPDICKCVDNLLRAAGVDCSGLSPSMENFLSGINGPMSAHEITSSRMWSGLNMDFMQLAILAFIVSSKVGQLDDPNAPNLPSFYLKTPPLSESGNLSKKPKWSDILVVPVLPLPYVLTLHEVGKNLRKEDNEFSAEAEVALQC